MAEGRVVEPITGSTSIVPNNTFPLAGSKPVSAKNICLCARPLRNLPASVVHSLCADIMGRFRNPRYLPCFFTLPLEN